MYNLKGFAVGNGITDMYIDSDSQLFETIVNWNMLPTALWTKM